MRTDELAADRPSMAQWLLKLWPAVIWLAAFVACRRLTRWSACIGAALWGLLLLLSFVAWGATVVRKSLEERPVGWGMEGTIGMALTLAVFGVLACLRLVSVATIALWAAAGPLLYGLTRQVNTDSLFAPLFELPARVRAAVRNPGAVVVSIALAALGIVAILHYAGSVMDVNFNTWDDEMAYRAFARQFLDTGTLYEPFSYRRVGAYGGQSLMQAMVLAFADRDRLHIFDNGICVLLLFGLMTGYRAGRERTWRVSSFLAGVLLLTLPYIPHNIGSALSGAVFFLALFRLLDDAAFEDGTSTSLRSKAIFVGLLAAAACTLRQNYLSAAVAFVGFVYLALIWSPGNRTRSEWLKQGVTAALAMFGVLIPWLTLSIIAARTPLYPMIQGNVRRDFGIIGKVAWSEELRWAFQNLIVFKPITTIALFFAASALLPFVRRNRALHAFMFANACAFALMMHFFQTFHDASSIARYYLAFSVAFCFAATLRTVTRLDWRPSGWRALVAAAIVVAAIGIQIFNGRATLRWLGPTRIATLRDLVHQRGPKPPGPYDDLYARIQASVPAHQPMLVILDHTYLFDGRRNVVFNYDHPGAVGPRGGPPCFKGPEAFAQYLHNLGIRYIAYQVGPSSAEYNPGYWVYKSATQVVINGRGNFYKIQARFELDFFAAVEALAATRKSLFQEGEIRVLDLEARVP